MFSVDGGPARDTWGEMQLIQLDEKAPDPLIGAGCTLDATQMPIRVREWAELRDRSTSIRAIDGGVAIGLAADEPIDRVADLAARESECCAFYTFVLRIEGGKRELEISAGEGREIAVQVLLGLA
jgi:hypothetical protein